MIRFRKGAYQLAADLKLPLVPITLNGPFEVLPIGSLNLKRHRMELIIHPPVCTEGLVPDRKGLELLADQTRQTIASALWEKYR